MHTHFGSATMAVSTFLSVLIVGTFWRMSWLHVLAFGVKRSNRHAAGIARAALSQY